MHYIFEHKFCKYYIDSLIGYFIIVHIQIPIIVSKVCDCVILSILEGTLYTAPNPPSPSLLSNEKLPVAETMMLRSKYVEALTLSKCSDISSLATPDRDLTANAQRQISIAVDFSDESVCTGDE
ncbi:hypothetical protein RHGRI_037391 [Rhododendron griersonianum]|uniref:Uncharacterized protein n=1 Tax=Rhododendron griersonianum TaxID=479676 RepID=A0AAV6HX09_9ERIC|nr:hypothetical protein RHGRI_037391 [Rhododendron griersonianum]